MLELVTILLLADRFINKEEYIRKEKEKEAEIERIPYEQRRREARKAYFKALGNRY